MAVFKKFISLVIIALVALQVLNLGLYAQDFDTSLMQQCYHRKINVINSVTEYIAEVVMQKRNAFPERKEASNQSDHELTFKFQPFKICICVSHPSWQPALLKDHNYNRFKAATYINPTTDIFFPPPKLLS